MNIVECINYNYKFIDLLVPSSEIIYKICLPQDKTRMFIISVVRIIIVYCIFFYLKNWNIIEWDVNKVFKTLGYMLVLFYLFSNIILIIILLLKKPSMDDKLLDKIATDTAKFIHDSKITEKIILSS